MAGYGLRAFLIAQSLNQIDKAYGVNHAILDNCHVRIAFATNDERTAKRISDALGTATELRAQRNYAGHRLAPWLGHLMVSRQETARPLLTPGEVMQLPLNEEVVMVSGHAPIRAAKLRYHEDRNFTLRILPPPRLANGKYCDCPPARLDDWSALHPLTQSTTTAYAIRLKRDIVPADGGLERRPELDPIVEEASVGQAHEEPAVPQERDELDNDGLIDRSFLRPDPRLQRAARLAALDPHDGIPL